MYLNLQTLQEKTKQDLIEVFKMYKGLQKWTLEICLKEIREIWAYCETGY